MAQIEKIDGNKAKLTIEIAPALFQKAITDAYHKSASRYNVPGFRKGKAPRKVIEGMYGQMCFYEDAFDACWGDAYDTAMEQNELIGVDRPEIEITSMSEAEGVTFVATVQLMPEVTLGQYKGIEVKAMDCTVSDEDVDSALKQEQEKQARFVNVERPVQSGDSIVLDYSGSVDGVKFDGGTAEGQTLVIGSGSFIPGFEDQLIGASAGEQRNVNVTFPTEYHAKELAGKEAVFECVVHTVSQKELPQIDDEFIKDISEFDTVADWKSNKLEELKTQKEKNAKIAKENDALKAACDNAQIDIPDCMIARQQDYMLRDMAQRFEANGISLEDYCAYMQTTVAQLRDTYKDEATARVKMQLVVEAVAKAEGIVATDEDVENEIESYAKQLGMDKEAFSKNLTSADRDYFADHAVAMKAVAVITDSAVAQ